MTKTVNIDGIGEVRIEKSPKAKRMNISIRPFEGIRVAIPHSLSYENAIKLIHQKRDWLLKNSAKIRYIENNKTVFDFDTDFQTKKHKLCLIPEKRTDAGVYIGNGKIRVRFPDDLDVQDEAVQEVIRFGVEKAWKREALEYLPKRMTELANKFGFSYREVKIRNQKTRWGSCSGVDNINLSLQLMRLPDYLIDYVLLHELCHTRVKSHGKDFWSLLDKVTGGRARILDKELSQYRLGIY